MTCDDCAILILSCDKFSDLWEPFFKLFWKYWPNCPYKVYLGSNEMKFEKDKRVMNVLSGKDIDWSTSYKRILDQIPEKYLFVWLEDAFITSPLLTTIFRKSFAFLKNKGNNHISLYLKPRYKKSFDKPVYITYEKGRPYTVTVIGFWNKITLQKLLINGESPWNFEIMGSYRSSYQNGYYRLLEPLIDYVHIVKKGKWTKEGVNYCKKNNVEINFGLRLQTKFDLYTSLSVGYFHIMTLVPWKIRLRIMNLFRKLLISY